MEPIAAEGQGRAGEAHLSSVLVAVDGHARHLESKLIGREPRAGRSTRFDRAPSTDRTLPPVHAHRRPRASARAGSSPVPGIDRRRGHVLRGRCLELWRGSRTGRSATRPRPPRASSMHDSVDVAISQGPCTVRRHARCRTSSRPTLGSAIGLSTAAVPGDAISWAVRRMLERLAESRPVVAVVEDILRRNRRCWTCSRRSRTGRATCPCLLLCPARPDLLEARPTWAAPAEATRPRSGSNRSAPTPRSDLDRGPPGRQRAASVCRRARRCDGGRQPAVRRGAAGHVRRRGRVARGSRWGVGGDGGRRRCADPALDQRPARGATPGSRVPGAPHGATRIGRRTRVRSDGRRPS